jgi:hypothetical protein
LQLGLRASVTSRRRPRLVGTTRVRRVLATELDATIADNRGGMGCVLMSRKYGIGENTMLARLKEAGAGVRPQGSLDQDWLCETASLRAEGWTLTALGDRYGAIRLTVVRLRRYQEAPHHPITH